MDAAALALEARAMLTLLEADKGCVEASFPFFLRKRAPVSGVESLLEYKGRWIVEATPDAATTTTWTEAVVPVKALCPCTK